MRGSTPRRLILATTADESTPPERKAPKGTSLMSRILTASSNRLSSSSSHWERLRLWVSGSRDQ